MDSLRSLFHPLNPRRAVLLGLFGGLVVLFRHLLMLLVFFVAVERPLGLASRWVARRTGMRRSLALLVVLGLVLALAGIALELGIVSALHAFLAAREALPERIAAFQQTPLFLRIKEYLSGAEGVVEAARHWAAGALSYLATLGHLLLQALIGAVLAVVYLLEQEEIESFVRSLDPRSLPGTLLRWLGYLADAASVTLQFQLVVAACNAVLTYPVLLLVGIPNATALVFMIFVSGMVPVVGNFLAGAVLTLLAYQASGWTGVGVFTALTFVLHKIESYYLNPRLAARHVRLPGFVLVVSLVLWEEMLGFKGLFISFPFLYVATRIRAELHAEAAAERPAA